VPSLEIGGFMKCTSIEFKKGNSFHFYNRAVDGEMLFFEDEDYYLFLNKFKKSIEKYPLSVFSYCLMPNHFHFFLRQNSDIKIYQIFNSVLSSYVQKYNTKYERRGSLMAGPLQSIIIEDDKYFLNLCRYIHLNPLKANLVITPEEWEYSNYSEWIGIRDGTLFDPEVFEICKVTPEKYKSTIENYLEHPTNDDFVKLLFDNERKNYETCHK